MLRKCKPAIAYLAKWVLKGNGIFLHNTDILLTCIMSVNISQVIHRKYTKEGS